MSIVGVGDGLSLSLLSCLCLLAAEETQDQKIPDWFNIMIESVLTPTAEGKAIEERSIDVY